MVGNCSFSHRYKVLIWLEQGEPQGKVHLEYPHCPGMKQKGWQWQEQRLDTEEEKSQEQMLQSPEDTDQVLWHCRKSEGTNGQQSF